MKSHKLRSIVTQALAAATLALGFYAAPAAATVYNIGAVSTTPYINSAVVSPGSFLDTYNFNLPLTGAVAASATSLDLLLGNMSLLHINNLAFSLYDNSNTFLGSWSGNPVNFGSTLNAGTYRFGLSGSASGLSGGVYVFSVAAIPEPEQWALFAVGLGLLGMMSRRRANRR